MLRGAALVAALVALAAAGAAAVDARHRSATWMMAGRRALARERERVHAGEAPSCQGLVGEMCKPCPSGGPDKFCADTKNECAALFCSPMCRRNTWKCKVTFGALEAESAKEELYSNALCGEFIAEGCSRVLGCCADDQELYDYVENQAYEKQYPQVLFPTPSCQLTSAEACSKCKAAAKVEVTPNECPFPSPEGGDGTAEPKTFEVAKDGAGKPFPGVNAHKGVQERCLKLEEKVTAQFGAMKQKFQENVCKCMGCCEGECFFPVTEKFPDGGVETGY